MNRYLIFSVDTEPDDFDWVGLHRGGWTHENLRGLSRLAVSCERMGVKPTYFISHSVALQAETDRTLLPFLKRGDCEVGAHLHPGDTPPFGEWDPQMQDNILQIPSYLLESKFLNLHLELSNRFGRPNAYRSAAWALDACVLGLLKKYGYAVESSVTPGISWRLNGRSSYLAAPKGAYWLDMENPSRSGNSNILEVPVSILSSRRWPDTTFSNRVFGDLFTMPMESRKGAPISMLRSIFPPPPKWLRPAFKNLDQMKQVVDGLADEEYLHIMCHSNEAWVKTSPYVRSQEELDQFYQRLEGICAYAIAKGYIPVTISQYAEQFAVSHPAPSDSTRVQQGEPLTVMPQQKRMVGPILLKGFISALAMALVFYQVDWRALPKDFLNLQVGMALICLFLMVLEISLNAAKVTRLCGTDRISPRKVFRFNFIKAFFNNFLPGGLGGEGARILLLSREIGSLGKVVAIVISDRLTGLLTQAAFTTFSFGYLIITLQKLTLQSSGSQLHSGALGIALGLAAGVGVLSAYLLFGPTTRFSVSVLERLPGFRWGTKSGEVESFLREWKRLIASDVRSIPLVIYCVVDQIILTLILFFAVHAFGGSLAFSQASPILLLVVLSSILPFSLGGIGITEGAYALAFSLVGLNPGLGLLVAILLRILSVVPSLLGGWFFLRSIKPSVSAVHT